jgi:dTMP kinase
VRREFLNLANVDPERYFVVDATQAEVDISRQINERVSHIQLLKINHDKKQK